MLRDYPVMGLRLHGAGKLAEVTATPVVNFPGTLLLNKPYAQLFTLTNLLNRSSIT